MPGRGTVPGPRLYPECGTHEGTLRHRRENTRRCAGCRAVLREEMARYRIERIVRGTRKVPAVGLRRRVQALARLGWTQRELAGRLGIPFESFKKIVSQPVTSRGNAEKVRLVYAELCWQQGPSNSARLRAERLGWPSPIDWHDPDDPAEIPLCEIERRRRAALEAERNRRKTAARRAVRQAGRASPARTEAAMVS